MKAGTLTGDVELVDVEVDVVAVGELVGAGGEGGPEVALQSQLDLRCLCPPDNGERAVFGRPHVLAGLGQGHQDGLAVVRDGEDVRNLVSEVFVLQWGNRGDF